jgi:glycosyltransferase involved in cell wall biosynthesis
MTPLAWPPLRNFGVVCCGEVDVHGAMQRGGIFGRSIGAVSKDVYFELSKASVPSRLLHTPATARAARFHRRAPRPVATLGWVGLPAAPGVSDVRRFSMFEEIAYRTGLSTLVSHGNYTYATMQDFYDEIDLLVCTSSSEGVPLPVFEAIACGVPVVSTEVGLVKECQSVPTFATVEQAVSIIQSLRTDPSKLEKCRSAQHEEFESRWCMERLLPLWERFFDACRGPAPSALMF